MASPKLPRRKLGNTGLEVSVIGFGASPLGGVFEVCPVRSKRTVLRDAHEAQTAAERPPGRSSLVCIRWRRPLCCDQAQPRQQRFPVNFIGS